MGEEADKIFQRSQRIARVILAEDEPNAFLHLQALMQVVVCIILTSDCDQVEPVDIFDMLVKNSREQILMGTKSGETEALSGKNLCL